MEIERQRLLEAIAAQENLRGSIDDAVIDATITALQDKLHDLDERDQLPKQQRKQVTTLFTDIVESTHIIQHLDPEDVREIFESALEQLAQSITVHEGRVLRYLGDGFLAVFGAPTAREDDPERAVHAGLQILTIAQTLSAELEKQWGIKNFQVRVGIHTGLVAMGGITEAEDTVMGSTVHLAKRLETAAPPGGLMISHDTYRHIRGVFDVEKVAPIDAKGFDEPIIAYRVLQEKPRAFRTYQRGVEGIETRMIGREAELKILQDALDLAIHDREGHIFTIFGEAGVGKSRLLYEFQIWIDLLPDTVRLFMGRGRQEAQNTPFALLRDLFAFRFEILDDDPQQTLVKKLEQGFGEIFDTDQDGKMRAHFIGQLLGFDFSKSPYLKDSMDDPQHFRNRAVMYLSEYLQGLTQILPVVIFLEDIHWGDDSSLDIINSLSSITPDVQLLIFCLARPILFERRPYWGEGLAYHTRIELSPLSKVESRQLVAEILQRVDSIPLSLRELLVGGAEGNPFYIEELVKMLIDNGVILPGPDSWHVELNRLGQIDVPTTLTGVLQARLDSLPPGEKLILQQASVVGRTFWDCAVIYIDETIEKQQIDDAEIFDRLTKLRAREMIYRREESNITGAEEYIFKHAILRDVTYDSVLKKVRQIYHQLVAKWLIQQSGERGGEYIGLIAEHLELGGETEAAINYYVQAGDSALERYANKESQFFFQRALQLEPTQQDRASILIELGTSISRQSRYDEADQVWEQAIDIYEEMGNSDKISQLYAYLARNAWHAGRFPEGLKIALEGLDEVKDSQDSHGKALLLHEAARAYYFNAETKLAVDLCQRAIAMADKLGIPDVKADVLSTLGALPDLNPDEKRTALEQAIEIAEQNGLLITANRAYNNLGSVYYYFFADIRRARECYLKAAEIAHKTAITHQEIYNRANVAQASIDLGELKDAQQQIIMIEGLQRHLPEPESINLWADKARVLLMGQSGRWEDARTLCKTCLVEAQKHSNLQFVLFFASYLVANYLELDRFKLRQNWDEIQDALTEAIHLSDRGLGGMVWCRCFKLSVLIRQGRFPDARLLLTEIEELTVKHNYLPDKYFLVNAKAELAFAETQYTATIDHLQELIEYYQRVGFRWEWARALLDLGAAYAARGQPGDREEALEQYSHSAKLFDEIGAPIYSQIAVERIQGFNS